MIPPSWFVITLISITSVVLTTLCRCMFVFCGFHMILPFAVHASCAVLVTDCCASTAAVVYVSLLYLCSGFCHTLNTIVLILGLVCTSLAYHCVSFISLACDTVNRKCRWRLLHTYDCLLDLCHLFMLTSENGVTACAIFSC